MRVVSLFAGIGGFDLGLGRAGMATVGFVENNPFCQQVLRKHWPEVPIHGDVTTREFIEGEADVICGGFPCTDLSNAGKRAGITGEHSGLYRELVRAIRVVRPRFAIMENVAALLGRGLDTVLGDLAESGLDAEWDCVPAAVVGAPHERDRIWIVAHPNSINGRSGAGRKGWSETCDRLETRSASFATHPSCQVSHSDTPSVGRGQGREGRPPDSFAGIRDEARRNAADPYGARLAFRAGLTRGAWEKLPPAERDSLSEGGQSIWPDEPALSGVDDGIPDWMDRVKATGNAVVPIIPEIIGKTIMAAEQ